MATLLAALAAKTVGHGGVSKGGCPPLRAGFKGAQAPHHFSALSGSKRQPWAHSEGPWQPWTHRVSGRGSNVSDEGVKRAVSRRVWPPRCHDDSGMANIAAPKDGTTRAAKDGLVWFHCSAPAVRYEGKCGAGSAHANHSENEPSMKGLMTSMGSL